MNHPIQFVSLGPGDPELLTLKSLKALQQADIIIAPAIQTECESETSRAVELIRKAGVKTPVQTVLLPMSKQRDLAMKAYNQICILAKEAYRQGKHIAIAVEGDAGIYASMHYVLERLQQENVATEQLPGIPSFIAAAAMAQFHLISQHERLIVLPGNATLSEIEAWVADGQTLVIMKLSRCVEIMKHCIAVHPEYEYHYFENVGTEQALHQTDPHTIALCTFPYFSLMIIRNKR